MDNSHKKVFCVMSKKFCHHLLTQVVQNLFEFLLLNMTIFWRMQVTKQLLVPIDFHSMGGGGN